MKILKLLTALCKSIACLAVFILLCEFINWLAPILKDNPVESMTGALGLVTLALAWSFYE